MQFLNVVIRSGVVSEILLNFTKNFNLIIHQGVG